MSSDGLLVFVGAQVKWEGWQIQCMCVKAKWMLKVKNMFDLSDIYIKEKAIECKNSRLTPAEFSAIGFTSRRRTWGT